MGSRWWSSRSTGSCRRAGRSSATGVPRSSRSRTPEGDPLRLVIKSGFAADTGDFNFLWQLFNRNKRGIALDLRVAESRPAFDKLIEDADVFITNFLPNAREKLHVNPEDLWKVNPRLVYAKGHGQGQRGPDADDGGFDAVSYWARGGLGHILTPAEGPLIMQRGAMGDRPERRDARRRRRRRALPAREDGQGRRRRRRAAQHGDLAARHGPHVHDDPSRGARNHCTQRKRCRTRWSARTARATSAGCCSTCSTTCATSRPRVARSDSKTCSTIRASSTPRAAPTTARSSTSGSSKPSAARPLAELRDRLGAEDTIFVVAGVAAGGDR